MPSRTFLNNSLLTCSDRAISIVAVSYNNNDRLFTASREYETEVNAIEIGEETEVTIIRIRLVG